MSVPPNNTLDPAAWVDNHGDYLFGFTLQRIRNQSQAEDLVQDTLLAAFKSKDRYKGASTERTWLTGILKNKIYSHYRKQGREITATDLKLPGSEDQPEFESNGHIIAEQGAKDWGSDPIRVIDQTEFQEALQRCLKNLPDRAAEVFLSREVDGDTTDEIAARHGISKNNLWVLLHRARRLLRACLEVNWFEKPEKT